MTDCKQLVQQILTDKPETRDSDDLLYLEVCKAISPIACDVSVEACLRNRAFYGIPTWETVCRARRNIQHSVDGLQPSDKAVERRYLHYKKVRQEYGYDYKD